MKWTYQTRPVAVDWLLCRYWKFRHAFRHFRDDFSYFSRVTWVRLRRVWAPHIHEACDGRPCHVYVDGKLVEKAFYADTRKGFVRYHFEPLRINRRRNDARWAKKRGLVTLIPI